MLAFVVLGLSGGAAYAETTPHAGMLRYPDVSSDRICFVYANNVWVVAKTGGVASPVSTAPGLEVSPKFSPDEKTIGFVASYDGSPDLYTVPSAGGIPTRVTYHPSSEQLCDWTPDGKLLYLSNAQSPLGRQQQVYTVAANGGAAEKLPLPYAGFGAISPDGEWLAYGPDSTDNRTWKRYRGGWATDLWLFNLKTHAAKQITDWEGTDTIPMWVPGGDGKTVYYLSDNGPEHRLNIWAYDIAHATREQVTTFAEDDVRWPSIGPGKHEGSGNRGEIVFQLGGKLGLLDLATKQTSYPPITIPGDKPTLKPKDVDDAEHIGAAAISPTGKRLIVEARGDLWSVPAKEGVVSNLTRTSGVFERDAAWSPDGTMIAYISDADGEYDLWVRPSGAKDADESDDADHDDHHKKTEAKKNKHTPAKPVLANMREPRRLTNLGAKVRSAPLWSPDSRLISVVDNAGVIFIVDVATGKTTTVDTDPLAGQPNRAWSPDSRFLAYDLTDEGNRQHAIWLYDVENTKKTRLISSMFGAAWPAFDWEGKYLYYVGSNAINNPNYSPLDTTFAYVNVDRLYAVPLTKDVKNPLAPKNDEEIAGAAIEHERDHDQPEKNDGDMGANDAKAGGKGHAKSKDTGSDAESEDEDDAHDHGHGRTHEPVKIDTEDFEYRAILLPVKAGSFANLTAGPEGTLLFVRRQPNTSDEDEESGTVSIIDLKSDKREEKTVVPAAGFELSTNGQKLVVLKKKPRGRKSGRDGEKTEVLVVRAQPDGKSTTAPTAGRMHTQIDPRAEWRQILTDVYRLERDYFYAENMHGIDWAKTRDHYAAMLEDAASREDLNFVLGEMVSELNVGHTYIRGGDLDSPHGPRTGLLGADYELTQISTGKAYRIKKVLAGAPWDTDSRGPLSTPGVNAKAGDYILAVNGVDIDTSKDIHAALVGTADAPTTITLSDVPTHGAGDRDVIVTPIANEAALRMREWTETNRAYVAEKTGGKVGYIYVMNTGVEGQNELFRQFFGQLGTQALIIDERWNGGGQIPSRFIELLNRPITNYYAVRYTNGLPWPPDANPGPKCMLANGQSGSGGDAFPWLFRKAGLGKLIGSRTWGGLVGISDIPHLIDDGGATAPDFAFYKTDGHWGIEGHGVDPDIAVVADPSLMTKGGDPQLDAAIAEMLDELKTRPYVAPKRPANPDRSGMGLPENDR